MISPDIDVINQALEDFDTGRWVPVETIIEELDYELAN